MNILVAGSGGREHALVWKLRQSASVETIWCAPGNGGIAAQSVCIPVEAGDVAGLAEFAVRNKPDLTVVGPELPLVNGLCDAFRERGFPIVGPSQQAAQLEGSKIFSKEFLLRHRIPTADMYGAYGSPGDAYGALCAVDWPVVIKADGLCGGKGVFVTSSPDDATNFIERVMEKGELGAGGRRVLFEEALEGDELSFIILTDGRNYAPLVPARDHKRVGDGNTGPNTGGMGAYSTDELLPPSLKQVIVSTIVEPTLRGLIEDRIPYQGFLYFGLMLTKTGPKVLEFNCRLGDPETQAIVMRMNFDLAEVLADVAAGKLQPGKLQWKPGASACVVMASGGYPGPFEKGKKISGLTSIDGNSGVAAFHAGTTLCGSDFLTSGGRVLGVTAAAASLGEALRAVYGAAEKIQFDGVHYRKDIGAHPIQAQVAGG